MATFLLTKNRTRRVLGLLIGLGLVIGVKSSSTVAAADTPTSITFQVMETACNNSTQVTFSANGTAVATLDPRGDCTCNPGAAKSVTVNAPSVLAMFATPGCTSVSMAWDGQLLVGWARALVNRPSGVESITLVDKTGSFSNSVCYAWESGVTYGFTVADTDGDGLNNCTDPDLDNDGVLNAVDNCPAVANADQADSDNNGVGNACQPNVVAVPWLGNESQPHQVYSGGALILQAAAYNPADGSPITLTSGTWDAGDGTGAQAINVSNSLNLELSHVYSGALGQPFTATVTVNDSTGHTYTDTFKVVIAANNRDTKVNMAIDKGLWHLHKVMVRNTSNGMPSGYWTYGGGWPIPSTAGAVQAFEVNNHRESGSAAKDPYTLDVARGLKFLLSSDNGKLTTTPNVALQGANDPDDNHNGYALYVPDGGHESYVTGQVVDAIVASGTPNAIATVGMAGKVKGRTYKDIVQDMLDGYSWGMGDGTGGWNYTYNDGRNDTSASHWWGIAVLAARTWGLDAPAWVKNIQKTVGIPLMQSVANPCARTAYGANDESGDGHFGYNNSHHWEWDGGTNVTAAGLVLMNADNFAQTNSRFTCASQFLADRYNNSMGNFYTMYQTTKAMRTAYDGAGNNAPITMLAGTRDWYAGYADYLVTNQAADGSFSSNGTAIGGGDMPSAWAIIMLSPALFEAAPNAVCSVDSSIVCSSGATCGAAQVGAYSTANFSGSQSTPGDNPIASYAWNFQDSTTASGVTASHQFSSIGTFPVKLTVTDTKGNASSATCNVTVTDTALPPVASTGGPYEICENRAGSVILDASGSIGRGANIVGYAWDFTTPVNFSAIDANTAVTDQTAFFRGLGVGSHDIAVRVSDDSLSHFVTTAYSTVTVLAANDPKCNANPAASDNSYTMAKNTTLSGNVVTDGTADSDADGDTFTAAVVTGPAQGTLTFNASGAFTYTPSANFDGVVTFTYKLTDQYGGKSNTATVTITVIKNTAPVAVNDTASTQSGTPVTVAVLPNDSDADGNTLTVTSTTAPANGAAVINGDGTVTYTPVNGFAGTDTFSYSISDGQGGTATATVTVTVTKRTATVTAGDGTKVYGSTDPAIGATSTGFAPADGITVSATRAAGEDVGTYATTATASGDLSNYDVTYVAGSFTITPATPVATATGGTFTYDGQPHAGTCTVAGVGTEVLTGTISYSSGGAPVNAGTYTVSCDFAGNTDYAAAATSTATITINKADAVCAVTGYTVTYDGAAHTATGACTGVDGGALAGLDLSASTHTAAGTTTDAWTFTDVTGNYNNASGTVVDTINKANAVCTVTGYNVHYDGAAHTATGTCTGVQGETLAGLNLSASTHTLVGVTTDAWTFTDVTGNYNNASGTVVDTIYNSAPVCQVNRPMQILWPPNHQLVAINPLAAVTDADQDPLTIKVLSIRQDEATNETGDGNTAIDGYGVGTAVAQVRAERTGNVKNPGNGRVYYITYTATDPAGASCTGTVTAGVPHDQGGKATPIGDGPLFDSTVATVPPPPAIKKLP